MAHAMGAEACRRGQGAGASERGGEEEKGREEGVEGSAWIVGRAFGIPFCKI